MSIHNVLAGVPVKDVKAASAKVGHRPLPDVEATAERSLAPDKADGGIPSGLLNRPNVVSSTECANGDGPGPSR